MNISKALDDIKNYAIEHIVQEYGYCSTYYDGENRVFLRTINDSECITIDIRRGENKS